MELSSLIVRAGRLLRCRSEGRYPARNVDDVPSCSVPEEIPGWLERQTGRSFSSDESRAVLSGVESVLWLSDSRALCLVVSRAARPRPDFHLPDRLHRQLTVTSTSANAQREQIRSVQAYNVALSDASRRMKVTMARQLLSACSELEPLEVLLLSDMTLMARSMDEVTGSAGSGGMRLLFMTPEQLCAHGVCEVMPISTIRLSAESAAGHMRLRTVRVSPAQLNVILLDDPTCVRVGARVGDVVISECHAFLTGSVFDARRVVPELQGPECSAVTSAPTTDGDSTVRVEEASESDYSSESSDDERSSMGSIASVSEDGDTDGESDGLTESDSSSESSSSEDEQPRARARR